MPKYYSDRRASGYYSRDEARYIGSNSNIGNINSSNNSNGHHGTNIMIVDREAAAAVAAAGDATTGQRQRIAVAVGVLYLF